MYNYRVYTNITYKYSIVIQYIEINLKDSYQAKTLGKSLAAILPFSLL